MKFKQYLRVKCDMTYSQFQALPDVDRWTIEGSFDRYNAALQKREQMRENFIRSGGIIRQATPEELEKAKYKSEIEREHRENSLKCGGISENGYIVLHYRHL